MPSLPISAVSSGTMNVTVPSGLWPNTSYHLLACPNDTDTVVEASTNNCIASTATAVSNQPALPPTTTSLAVSSGGGAVTSVTSGSVVTLTATVVSGSAVVPTGQVNFCDASATYCTDIHLLGTAQLTSAGTAVLEFRPAIGSHSYKAVFVGTVSAAGSSSSTSALTVTGKYPTETTIAQSGIPGNYTLTATVAGSGPASPTGEVSFLDTSNGNFVLGMAALVAGMPVLNWMNSQTPATGGYPYVRCGGGLQRRRHPRPGHSEPWTLHGDDTSWQRGRNISCSGEPDGRMLCHAVAVGDFNGDGKADLAVVWDNGASPGAVRILLGNGDGTFTPAPVEPGGGAQS